MADEKSMMPELTLDPSRTDAVPQLTLDPAAPAAPAPEAAKPEATSTPRWSPTWTRSPGSWSSIRSRF